MTNRTTRGLLLIVLGLLVVFGLWVYVGERDPDDIVDFFKRGKIRFLSGRRALQIQHSLGMGACCHISRHGR